MRLPPVFAVAFLLLAAPSVRADDDPDGNAEVRACTALLASKDKAVRGRAAVRILELMGGIEKVARSGTELDPESWRTFSDACVASGWSHDAVLLVAAAYTAPEARRERLLDLARRIDPEAGRERTSVEIDAVLQRNLVESRNSRCSNGCDTAVSLLGHQAVPAVLALLRDADRNKVDVGLACSALEPIVEREDLPALRELLLAGRTSVAEPLGALLRHGVTEAQDALLEAVAAGSFDRQIAEALRSSTDRARTVKAVRAWLEDPGHGKPGEYDRAKAADLFGALGARETAALLESWIPEATKSPSFVALGHALARLGSREGVRILVRIVAEPDVPGRCCNPSAAAPPGSLCASGFYVHDRLNAARRLAGIAGPAVVALPGDGEMPPAGTKGETNGETVDRAAAAFKAWWEASKDALRFDPGTGRWSVGNR
jgi:hypothetical protein